MPGLLGAGAIDGRTQWAGDPSEQHIPHPTATVGVQVLQRDAAGNRRCVRQGGADVVMTSSSSNGRRIEVARAYTFDASHQLDWHPGKCSRLHGHTYHLQVTVTGPVSEVGVVIDFDDLDVVVRDHALEQLDHRHLNDIVNNPTVENVLIHVWDTLDACLQATNRALEEPQGYRDSRQRVGEGDRAGAATGAPWRGIDLSEITLWETPKSWARIRA